MKTVQVINYPVQNAVTLAKQSSNGFREGSERIPGEEELRFGTCPLKEGRVLCYIAITKLCTPKEVVNSHSLVFPLQPEVNTFSIQRQTPTNNRLKFPYLCLYGEQHLSICGPEITSKEVMLYPITMITPQCRPKIINDSSPM